VISGVSGGETGSTPNPVNGRLLQLDTMAELAKD
jgi:hypothetical protein